MASFWIFLKRLHNHICGLAYGNVQRDTIKPISILPPKPRSVRQPEAALEAMHVSKAEGSFMILRFASRQ